MLDQKSTHYHIIRRIKIRPQQKLIKTPLATTPNRLRQLRPVIRPNADHRSHGLKPRQELLPPERRRQMEHLR